MLVSNILFRPHAHDPSCSSKEECRDVPVRASNPPETIEPLEGPPTLGKGRAYELAAQPSNTSSTKDDVHCLGICSDAVGRGSGVLSFTFE
jgi:hypothetical protein